MDEAIGKLREALEQIAERHRQNEIAKTDLKFENTAQRKEIERLEGAVNELDALVGSLRLEISSSATRAESLEKQLEAVLALCDDDSEDCFDGDGELRDGHHCHFKCLAERIRRALLDRKGDK